MTLSDLGVKDGVAVSVPPPFSVHSVLPASPGDVVLIAPPLIPPPIDLC